MGEEGYSETAKMGDQGGSAILPMIHCYGNCS